MSFFSNLFKRSGKPEKTGNDKIDATDSETVQAQGVDEAPSKEGSIDTTARIKLMVLENTAHKGPEYKKLIYDNFMEVADWMTYLIDSEGNSMYRNPEDSEKFSNQAFDECMAKRFTDDNYAYVSGGRGQGFMLYKGKAIEEILTLTGLDKAYTWQPIYK